MIEAQGRCGAGDHGARDRDGDCRCRLCLLPRSFDGLERRRIDPVIPTRKDPSRSPVPLRRFRYDARHHLVKCPRGKILHPVRRLGRGQVFLSRVSDCACCPLKGGCLPASHVNKEVVVPHDLPGAAPGPAVGVHGGARTISGCTNVTFGVPRASTARPRPGTGSGALSGAVSTT